MATVFSLMGQAAARSNQAGQNPPQGRIAAEGAPSLGFGEILASGQMSLFAGTGQGRQSPGVVLSATTAETGGADLVHTPEISVSVGSETEGIVAINSGNTLPLSGESLPDSISLQLPLGQTQGTASTTGEGDTELADELATPALAAGAASTPQSTSKRPSGADVSVAVTGSTSSGPTELGSESRLTAVSTRAGDAVSEAMDSRSETTQPTPITRQPSSASTDGLAATETDGKGRDVSPTTSASASRVPVAEQESGLRAESSSVSRSPSNMSPTTERGPVEGNALHVAKNGLETPAVDTANRGVRGTEIAEDRRAEHALAATRTAREAAVASNANTLVDTLPASAISEPADRAAIAAIAARQPSDGAVNQKRERNDKGGTVPDGGARRVEPFFASAQRPSWQIPNGASGEQRPAQPVSTMVSNGQTATAQSSTESGQRSASFSKEMEWASVRSAMESDGGSKSAALSPAQHTVQNAKPLPQFTIAQPVGQSPGWEQAMAGRIVWMGAQGVQSASLTLNPQDLGAIQIQVDIAGDQANVQFQAQSAETCDLIEKLMPRLSHALEGQGLKLEDSKVSQFTPSQDFSSAQQQAANQSSGRQGGEGAQQRDRAGGGNPSPVAQESSDELAQSLVMHTTGGVDYYA